MRERAYRGPDMAFRGVPCVDLEVVAPFEALVFRLFFLLSLEGLGERKRGKGDGAGRGEEAGNDAGHRAPTVQQMHTAVQRPLHARPVGVAVSPSLLLLFLGDTYTRWLARVECARGCGPTSNKRPRSAQQNRQCKDAIAGLRAVHRDTDLVLWRTQAVPSLKLRQAV